MTDYSQPFSLLFANRRHSIVKIDFSSMTSGLRPVRHTVWHLMPPLFSFHSLLDTRVDVHECKPLLGRTPSRFTSHP